MKSGLRRLAVRNQAPIPGSPGGRYALPFMGGGSGSSETYMRTYGLVGTIFSCVSLYATATAAPEWHLYRKNTQATAHARYTTRDEGSDQREEVFDHLALQVLNRPNDFFTRMALFETDQQYLDLTGESYWAIERDPRATFPLGIWPVRPDRMEPVPDPKTYLKGYVYTSPDGTEKIPLLPHEVIMVKYPNPLDAYHGLGPVQSVLVDIDASRYSAEWNRNFFLNSAEPGGIVQADHTMEDDEFDTFINRWRESHRGVARAHRVGLLEGGMTWVPNEHSMKDMDFAALRGVGRDIIREAFRMHKVMLGVSDDVNRANAQTGQEVFSAWGVVPRLDRRKDAINNQFLPMFGTTGNGVEFDYVRPVPTNREQDAVELTAKTAAVALLVGAGFDAEDACEVVGLPVMRYQRPAVAIAAPPPAAKPEAGQPDGEDAPGGGVPAGTDMEARVRRMLANGHLPVLTGRP